MPRRFVTVGETGENGPTTVGDEWSDPVLMKAVGAELVNQLGNNFQEYRTPDPPRIVLDKLEKHGYSVITMTGIGQTCVWTLHKPLDGDSKETIDSSQICNDIASKDT